MALNETAKRCYEREVERLLGLDDVKIIKEKFLDMQSQIDDLYIELGERARRISKLEEENKEAKDKTHKLEVELAEKDAWFKIRGGLNAEPLPFSDEQYEEDLIAELEDRHQQDCITINQLHVTIDTLVDRYAKLREMKGL